MIQTKTNNLPLIIIKIGGAIITEKSSSTPKFNSQHTKKIAQVLSEISNPFILVHGAGSYGHSLVQQHSLLTSKTQTNLKIWSKLQNLQYDLNNEVCNVLRQYDFAPFSLQASSFFNPNQPYNINNDTVTIIKTLINKEFTPVLYGTPAIFDDKSYILSGDLLILTLASIFNAHKLIFITDVDGIFDKNPHNNPDAKLYSEIDVNSLKLYNINFNSNDASGSMSGKFNTAVQAAIKGFDVYIVNGNYPKRIKDIFNGDFIGTLIYK